MAQNNQGPKLSLKERDRRYAAIREKLKEQGVDCVIVKDSNLFYLTNGLVGERYGLLPHRRGGAVLGAHSPETFCRPITTGVD